MGRKKITLESILEWDRKRFSKRGFRLLRNEVEHLRQREAMLNALTDDQTKELGRLRHENEELQAALRVERAAFMRSMDKLQAKTTETLRKQLATNGEQPYGLGNAN